MLHARDTSIEPFLLNPQNSMLGSKSSSLTFIVSSNFVKSMCTEQFLVTPTSFTEASPKNISTPSYLPI